MNNPIPKCTHKTGQLLKAIKGCESCGKYVQEAFSQPPQDTQVHNSINTSSTEPTQEKQECKCFCVCCYQNRCKPSLSETIEWEKQFHDEIWNKFDLGLEFRTVVKETIEAFIASVVDKEVEKALQKDRIGIFTRIAGSGMAKGRGDELAELISPRYLKHKE